MTRIPYIVLVSLACLGLDILTVIRHFRSAFIAFSVFSFPLSCRHT